MQSVRRPIAGARSFQEAHVAITIRDVAQAAGVSTATVSRALRGLPNVDDQTRQRVCRVAADRGLRDLAQCLPPGQRAHRQRGCHHSLHRALVLLTVLSGAESVLASAGIDLLLMSVSNPFGQMRLPRRHGCGVG
jgi:DNA-binding LacI/PurR family transcriptional regulator